MEVIKIILKKERVIQHRGQEA